MSVYAAIPLIPSIIYTVLIVIVVYFAWKRVRLVFLSYLSVAVIWSLSSFLLHADFFPQQTLLLHKILIIASMASWVLYYHFIRAVTNQKSMRGVLFTGYVLLIIAALLTSLGYVIKSTYVSNGLLYYELIPLSYLSTTATAALMLGAAIFTLVRQYRSSSSYLERNRTAYLLAGLGIMVLFSFTNLSSSLSKYSIDHIGNLANALFITYAIVRYQLLDIKVFVRRGLAYSVLTIGLTTLYLLVLFFIVQMLFHAWTSYATLGTAVVLALLLAITFQPLRNVTQQWVDRLFYRGTYDYRQTLLTFSQRMSNVLNLGELAENMLYPITKALGTKQAFLFLPEAEGGDFGSRFVQPPSTKESATTTRLRRDSPIVAYLDREGKALDREHIDILPEFKSLWEAEREELKALELEVFCPMKRKGNLVGILALSKKQSDTPYSGEDIDLLTTITTEAAMVIENATILDNLKEQQLRVGQLLARTVQAQEEERKRISIELHDTVTQWLVSASYRVQACNSLLSPHDNGDASSELQEIEKSIDQSLKELRRVMTGLHPPALAELGLIHSLRQIAGQLESKGIACSFETTGTPARLPPSLEITIYRIVQEALTNVQKHADATKVILRLQFQSDNVLAEIRDDGKGFNLSQTLSGAISLGHLGLLGMKQRAETAGGTLKIETRPGAGTSIALRFPILPDTYEGSSESHKEGK